MLKSRIKIIMNQDFLVFKKMPAQNNCPEIEKSALYPTILIAGGAGFLGSHLARKLLDKKARVIVLDNLSQGKVAYINDLLTEKKFTLIEHDLNKGLPVNLKSVDYIFHLAALESYQFGNQQASLDSLLTNSLGTKALLDLAVSSKAKFLLSSTIDVYQGILSSYDLEHYFGPSEYEEKKFSHLEAKRFSESLVWEYFKKENLNARIARLPEMYGPRMDFKSSGNLGHLLDELTKGEDLKIYGDGLDKEYYVYIEDAVEGLIKAMFGKGTEGKIYPITPTEPITALELAYLTKKFAPAKSQVVFMPAQTKLAFPSLQITDEDSLKTLNWKPETKLEEGIRKTLESFNYNFPKLPQKVRSLENSLVEGVEKITEIIPESLRPSRPAEKIQASVLPKKPKRKMSKLAFIPLAILGGILIFSVPFVSFGVNVYLGAKNLVNAKNQIASLETVKAQKSATAAENNFNAGMGKLRFVYPLLKLTGRVGSEGALYNLLLSGKHYASAAESLAKAENLLSKAMPKFPASSDKMEEKSFLSAGRKIETAVNQFYLASSEMDKVEIEKIKIPLVNQKLKEKIEEAKDIKSLDRLGKIVKSLPEVLGYRGSQKYLVLFENPNEIRPNGGFIGSFALIDFKEGQIENLKIDDVYNVDGLLLERKLYQTPPEQISKYLKQDKLLIRDANWNPDFPKSAEVIKNLYLRATGETVDGVAFITLDFVKELLKVTGPLYLTDYNEVVDEKNLFERAQYHSEANYYEGSPQKKNFLGSLSKMLMDKIFSLPNAETGKLVGVLSEGFVAKSLAVYFPPSIIRGVFAENGWDGSVEKTNGDYLYLVEANLGANKANYFVSKTVDYEVSNTNREGRLQANLKITFFHKGETNDWPGGTYKNYLRILVPENSYLQKAEAEERGKEKKDVTKEVVVEDASSKRTFGYYFEMEPGSQVTLSLNYFLPPTVTIKPDSKSYELLVQKQSGAKSDEPFSFRLVKPFGKDFAENAGLKISDSEATLTLEMNKNLHISVPFR